MSEYYLFGMHIGHLTAQADRIAKSHGALHLNYTSPRGELRGWFACRDLGEPFNTAMERAVLADIEAHKRDCMPLDELEDWATAGEAFPDGNQYRDHIAQIAAEVQRHREIEALFPELVETSSDVRSFCIPGMHWTDEVGQLLLARLDAALARAKELLR